MDFDYSTMSNVAPGIFISNWEASINPAALEANSIRGILTIVNSHRPDSIMQYQKKSGIESMHIYLDDIQEAPLSDYFEAGYNFIEKFVKRGQNVLIYCMMGISRSATMILYYLSRKYGNINDSPEKTLAIHYEHFLHIRPITPIMGSLTSY